MPRIFLFLLISQFAFAQHSADLLTKSDSILEERGEVYVTFDRVSSAVQNELYDILYFDHGSDHNTSLAYIPQDRFEQFLEFDIPFSIVSEHYEPRREIKMMEVDDALRTGSCLKTSWDFYPTYEAYLGMMQQFAAEFPEICEFHSLGTLDSGREILALKISDNVSERENEPKFLYTSTMHGDETAGFPLLLRLSDHLLCQYDNDARIKELIDNVEIWINPLANPDGTYRNDNSTVVGATRGNGNNVDLNRNFPDPDDGPHPDGRDYQEETLIFMDFAEREKINMSSNFHGGVEVFNYPWDTFSELPADVEWWLCMGRMYADTVHQHAPSGYFNYLDNGVTNGYEWYEVRGGRQDYMTYNFGGREFTLELSDQKLLNSSELPDNWEYNYRSLINFLAEANNGLRGVITDSETGEPIEAEVFIENHDALNSHVYSTLPHGSYFRYLAEGTYTMRYVAEDYKEELVTISIGKGEQLIQDVELTPRSVSTQNVTDLDFSIWTDQSMLHIETPLTGSTFQLFNVAGKEVLSNKIEQEISLIKQPENIPSGLYFVKLTYLNQSFTKKIFL